MDGYVDMPSSQQKAYIEGPPVSDTFSFDDQDEMFVDNFVFLYADFIEYKELENEIQQNKFQGVIGLNRFGFDNDQMWDKKVGL